MDVNLEIIDIGKRQEWMVDISLVRSGNLCALKVYGDGMIPVSDYKIQSSEDGETELCVTIRGVPNELELKASLIQSKAKG